LAISNKPEKRKKLKMKILHVDFADDSEAVMADFKTASVAMAALGDMEVVTSLFLRGHLHQQTAFTPDSDQILLTK
jgi:hypothetical protein